MKRSQQVTNLTGTCPKVWARLIVMFVA